MPWRRRGVTAEVRGLLFGFPGTVLPTSPLLAGKEKPVIAAQRLSSALVVDAPEPRMPL